MKWIVQDLYSSDHALYEEVKRQGYEVDHITVKDVYEKDFDPYTLHRKPCPFRAGMN